MTPRQLDRLITAIVIILVAGLMIGFAAIIYIYNDGGMEQEAMLMCSTVMSSAMFLVVIIYAVYSYKLSNSREKEKKLEEMQKRGKE